jgi:hypothetical protein
VVGFLRQGNRNNTHNLCPLLRNSGSGDPTSRWCSLRFNGTDRIHTNACGKHLHLVYFVLRSPNCLSPKAAAGTVALHVTEFMCRPSWTLSIRQDNVKPPLCAAGYSTQRNASRVSRIIVNGKEYASIREGINASSCRYAPSVRCKKTLV